MKIEKGKLKGKMMKHNQYDRDQDYKNKKQELNDKMALLELYILNPNSENNELNSTSANKILNEIFWIAEDALIDLRRNKSGYEGFEDGYLTGHNATVEGHFSPEEAAADYLVLENI